MSAKDNSCWPKRQRRERNGDCKLGHQPQKSNFYLTTDGLAERAPHGNAQPPQVFYAHARTHTQRVYLCAVSCGWVGSRAVIPAHPPGRWWGCAARAPSGCPASLPGCADLRASAGLLRAPELKHTNVNSAVSVLYKLFGPVHTGCGGARKWRKQKLEQIVANGSVHTALNNIKGFAPKPACGSCVNQALN